MVEVYKIDGCSQVFAALHGIENVVLCFSYLGVKCFQSKYLKDLETKKK